jgi:hypothetical protein
LAVKSFLGVFSKSVKKLKTLNNDNAKDLEIYSDYWSDDEVLSDSIYEDIEDLDDFDVKHCASILFKIKNTIKRLIRSTSVMGVFKSFAKEIGDNIVPLLDVPTRWNSTFLMINRAVRLREPLEMTVIKLNWMDLKLSEIEWTCLKDISEILGKFEKATTKVSGMKRLPIIVHVINISR